MKKIRPLRFDHDYKMFISLIIGYVMLSVLAMYVVVTAAVYKETALVILGAGAIMGEIFKLLHDYVSDARSAHSSADFDPDIYVRKYGLKGRIKGKNDFFNAVYFGKCNMPGEALKNFKDCLRIADNPNLRLACYCEITKIAYGEYQKQVVEEILLEGYKEFHANEIFYAIANYYSLNVSEEGIKWLETVTKNSRDDDHRFTAHYNLADIYVNTFRYEEAEQHYIKALDLHPETFSSWLHGKLALCKAALGKYDEARKHAVQAMLTCEYDEYDENAEIFELMFIAKTGEMNPEIKKMYEELEREQEKQENYNTDSMEESK